METCPVTSKGSKLIAIVLLVVVVAGGLGYWALSPKMPSQLATYTTPQTSILTSYEETLPISTSSIAFTSETTLWINVSAIKPVSHYLSLLKSTGTQPYVQLAWELQALPDATNATAVAKITYLALNATNPEVKEAFELMMKGGTPSPSDFRYTVPQYNTELQILYCLALENEFKKDDTLALAIAMVNGLWVTMGDNQVGEAVRIDASDLLAFFRETNELQKERGYYSLEHYPLEAKVALAWTANRATLRGPYNFYHRDPGVTKVTLDVYEWNNVNTDTLRKMRQEMTEKRWDSEDPNSVVAQLVDRFWGGFGPYVYELLDNYVGKPNYDPDNTDTFANIDLLYELYAQGSVSRLNCADLTAFVDSWAKSWGIATIAVWQIDGRLVQERQVPNGHVFVTYFDPYKTIWTSYQRDFANFQSWSPARRADDPHKFYIFVFPVRVSNPPWTVEFYGTEFEECTSFFAGQKTTTIPEMQRLFLEGIPTRQMKQWLLYS